MQKIFGHISILIKQCMVGKQLIRNSARTSADTDMTIYGHDICTGPTLNSSPLDKMAAISQTIFSDAFLLMKSFLFLLIFSLKLAPKGPIVPFDKDFSPSGEQLELRKLAHELQQPTAGCIAMFHKYCCYTKHGSITASLTLRNHWGYVTDV